MHFIGSFLNVIIFVATIFFSFLILFFNSLHHHLMVQHYNVKTFHSAVHSLKECLKLWKSIQKAFIFCITIALRQSFEFLMVLILMMIMKEYRKRIEHWKQEHSTEDRTRNRELKTEKFTERYTNEKHVQRMLEFVIQFNWTTNKSK